ncbi:hypothetical protein MBLNU230_g7803t1 [Neophaeotheca triangularis]
MGIPWGRGSDRYGRKPAILLGLTTTLMCSLLFGFSTGMTQALIARGLMGAGAGNVGIIRTTVAEMVPYKELQPRAFSVMPLVWNVGSVLGPILGGVLANPLGLEPEEMGGKGGLLVKYPYALPNIVSAAFFGIGSVTGVLFLKETLESKKHNRDYGILLGKKITSGISHHAVKLGELLHLLRDLAKQGDGETDPLIKRVYSDDEDTMVAHKTRKPSLPAPSYREVLNRQSVINLVVYTLLAAHTLVCDQILAVFMHYPRLHSTSNPQNHLNASSTNAFQFSGGLGLTSAQIGFLSTLYGIISLLTQLVLFPPLVRRFGSLNCLKVCAIGFPITYFLVPFTALLPTQQSAKWTCFVIYVLKGFCAIFSFPCSTILLTNSASSLRVLGTLNGIAVSTSAIGRAVGPAVTGAVFTWGVEQGYIIAPWWLLTGIAVAAAVPVWWLIEGKGFGEDEEVAKDGDEEEGELNKGPRGDATISEVSALVSRQHSAPACGDGKSFRGSADGKETSAGNPLLNSPDHSTRPLPEPGRRASITHASSPVTIGKSSRTPGKGFSTSLGASLGAVGSWNG